MRPETVRRHRGAIRRALDYISAEADSAIRLDRVADAAAMSPYHFAHVYEGYVGEPLMKTLRRRRLRQAEAELARSSIKIAAVARTAGYASGQAFARAYKRLTGLTPSDLRGGTLDGSAKTELSAIRLVTLAARPACGIAFCGNYRDEAAAFNELLGHAYADVDLAAMSRFRRSVRGVSILPEGWPTIGRPCKRTVAVVADGMPRRYAGQAIPGGRYAVIRHHGSLAQAGETARIARDRIQRELGLAVTDRPMLCNWVSDGALLPADQFVLDIYLPVAR